ncbi:nitroreductase family protein [Spirochaeta isovalerica]|uniref:Nitroreductase n=1 Tax=Spirochaeta isovalerica TaxID=150 RepID=A0A841R8W5_9SPIO|nr:nitroreductase family protein [Spirochaeta isovalerica]MBB6479399.1 nitroreductase [Spirochaeta isovalerica]
MELFEAIAKRYSYRGEFTDQKVPEEDLVHIVQAGIQAPSGKNSQTTEFVIITDKADIEAIAGIIGYKYLKTAPALIAVFSDTSPTMSGYSFYREDYAAAVENILLAVTAYGYSSLWIDGALRSENRIERISKLLNAPADRLLTVVLPVGKAVNEGVQNSKKPFGERAWFGRYGS